MATKLSFMQPFKIIIERNHTSHDCLIWFTDGSKKEGGAGAGLHGATPTSEICIFLNIMTTVHRYAIVVCVLENIRRQYNKKKILIYSDREPALKALQNHRHNPKLT